MVDIEKRRYKITGFRELPNSNNVRVLLESAEIITSGSKPKTIDMIKNPGGFAQNLMNEQMNKLIHDTFLISKEEYFLQKYMVGDHVLVTIERE